MQTGTDQLLRCVVVEAGYVLDNLKLEVKLGYSQLPFLQRCECFVYPIALVAAAFVLSLLEMGKERAQISVVGLLSVLGSTSFCS